MEYIKKPEGEAGGINVIEYETDFLAMHNIKQFEKTISKTGRSWSRSGVPVSYDQAALNSLAEKLQPIARDKNRFPPNGFEIKTKYPVTMHQNVTQIDFSKTLNANFVARYTEDKAETRSLNGWLESANNTFNKQFKCLMEVPNTYNNEKLVEGRSYSCMVKAAYLAVLDQQYPLELWAPPESHKDIIDGAVIYHATRQLGNDILNSTTSEIGDLHTHEGIVLSLPNVANNHEFKITGEFIVEGIGGRIAKKMGK
jgi:hypothetical protein